MTSAVNNINYIISLLLLFYVISTVKPQSCEIGSVSFTSLFLTSDYYTATASNGDIIHFNICGEVTNEYCITSPSCSSCQLSQGLSISAGKYDSSTTFYRSSFVCLLSSKITFFVINLISIIVTI